MLTATREQLDLRDQAAVNYWFRANRPEYVFLVAGTVGGILANSTRPAEFIYDNMMIHATVVHAAHLLRRRRSCSTSAAPASTRASARSRSRRSTCSPGRSSRPTSPYAIAKIAGIKLCQAYRAPVRLRLHLGHADQPLRPERQLRPARLARAARR